MKNKKKINWMLFAAIIILIISFILFLIALNLGSILIIQKQEIPVIVRISDYNAFNISKNDVILNLGTVKKGNAAGPRNINIENSRDFPTIVEVDVKGDIAPLLVFDKVIYLKANENKEIPISTKFIEDEEFGDYSGVLIITFKKAIV